MSEWQLYVKLVSFVVVRYKW